MAMHLRDDEGNVYVRETDSGGVALVLIGGALVLCYWALKALVSFLDWTFQAVAGLLSWVYDAPFPNSFAQSADSVLGAWYWLVILKPFSLVLHLFATVGRCIGAAGLALWSLAAWIWDTVIRLTQYPNMNLVLATIAVVVTATFLSAILYWAWNASTRLARSYVTTERIGQIRERVRAPLRTAMKAYVGMLVVPFVLYGVFQLSTGVLGWLFATS